MCAKQLPIDQSSMSEEYTQLYVGGPHPSPLIQQPILGSEKIKQGLTDTRGPPGGIMYFTKYTTAKSVMLAFNSQISQKYREKQQ